MVMKLVALVLLAVALVSPAVSMLAATTLLNPRVQSLLPSEVQSLVTRDHLLSSGYWESCRVQVYCFVPLGFATRFPQGFVSSVGDLSNICLEEYRLGLWNRSEAFVRGDWGGRAVFMRKLVAVCSEFLS